MGRGIERCEPTAPRVSKKCHPRDPEVLTNGFKVGKVVRITQVCGVRDERRPTVAALIVEQERVMTRQRDQGRIKLGDRPAGSAVERDDRVASATDETVVDAHLVGPRHEALGSRERIRTAGGDPGRTHEYRERTRCRHAALDATIGLRVALVA